MKTTIIIICIFCTIVSGIILTSGYETYEEYRENKSTTEFGKDLLGGIDNNAETITATAKAADETINFFMETLPKFFTEDIPTFFNQTLPNIFEDFGEKIVTDIGTFFENIWNRLRAAINGEEYEEENDEGFGGGSFGGRH